MSALVAEYVILSTVPSVEHVLQHSPASINAQDAKGSTPLHLAASLNRADVVQLFLQSTLVDDSIRDVGGRTCTEVGGGSEVAGIISGELFQSFREFVQSDEGGVDYLTIEQLLILVTFHSLSSTVQRTVLAFASDLRSFTFLRSPHPLHQSPSFNSSWFPSIKSSISLFLSSTSSFRLFHCSNPSFLVFDVKRSSHSLLSLNLRRLRARLESLWRETLPLYPIPSFSFFRFQRARWSDRNDCLA